MNTAFHSSRSEQSPSSPTSSAPDSLHSGLDDGAYGGAQGFHAPLVKPSPGHAGYPPAHGNSRSHSYGDMRRVEDIQDVTEIVQVALTERAEPDSIEPDWTQLTVRKLEVDLSRGFAEQWHRNAFLTQYHNALSMSFPVGEQLFIDAVRNALPLLPAVSNAPEHASLRGMVAQFVGQEATHRHVHALYNVHLEKQGLDNRWQRWALRHIAKGQARKLKPLQWLAITAAYEHITAVLADGVLRHDSWMAGADSAMTTIWKWHAAEEIEHRAVAFDLYMAAGGTRASRLRWYAYVLSTFTWDASRQTALNLWHAGRLSHFSTWWHGAQFLLGRDGLVWRSTGPLLGYFKRDFHPHNESGHRPDLQARALARRWLADNAASFRVVS